VGQIFLEHYVPLWDESSESPAGWLALHENAGSLSNTDRTLI
jgi:hypothetical protein